MQLTMKKALTPIMVSALALSAAPALAAGGSDGSQARPGGAGNTEMSREVLAALQRDLGLSEQQARAHGAAQARAIKLDRDLRASLGAAFAGSAYDARTGKLVVMVSDPAKVDEAKGSGADARPATRSKAELDAIMEELDQRAGKAQGSSAAKRRHNGPRQASAAGLIGWHVDEPTNTVRVTIEKARAAQARASLAKYGDAVTIEETDLLPTPTAFMDGGDLINGASCSAGFNLRNPSTGAGFLLTAGHCVSAGSSMFGQGGARFGTVLESWFPTYDDALARKEGTAFTQGPWVDTNPSNGSIITTSSYTDAPVGTIICKSGVTTRWTCGRITAKDQTVTYTGNKTVHGLTRHNACVEKGDSGGANVSVTSSYRAEGVTSGAQLRWDGTRYRCLAAFGQPNVSWYYPIADSLRYYGPKYGVTTW